MRKDELKMKRFFASLMIVAAVFCTFNFSTTEAAMSKEQAISAVDSVDSINGKLLVREEDLLTFLEVLYDKGHRVTKICRIPSNNTPDVFFSISY